MAITFGGGITISAGAFNAGLLLNAPTITTATSLTSTTASIVYSAPFNNIGAPLLYYVATASPGGLTGTLSQTGSGTIKVSGLTSGQTYTFTVVAYNQFGAGAVSTASGSVLIIAVPCAPTIGTATALTNSTTATVTYSAPASNGGSTIISYIATSNTGGITATLSQAGSGTITVTGLSVGNNYTFKVVAVNSVGTGPSSSCSNSIYVPVPSNSQSYTSPGTYSWIAPSGVTSVSVVAVGAGGHGGYGSGNRYPGIAGAGGALAYKNNITVTPGNSYTVVVPSQNSGTVNASKAYFCSASVVAAGSGGGGTSIGTGGCGGTVIAGTGGSGGNGGYWCSCYFSGGAGAGGAGGYSGSGGRGGSGAQGGCYGTSTNKAGTAGSGGGGGGASGTNNTSAGGGGGGGVGLFGQGSNGTGGTYCIFYSSSQGIGGGGGSGGSGGTNNGSICITYKGIAGNGGSYGGGGGGGGSYVCSPGFGVGGCGASGAVRIVWPGNTRTFPSTCVGTP